jgi:bifunctional non-homologous end joining protein LigD
VAVQRRKVLGIKAAYPGFIEPALASSVDKVPDGARWIHEIKFDGYRVQVHLQNGRVKVFTRRGYDWTKRFRKIASDASESDAGSAIIDGEVVVPSASGLTDFPVLQNELKGRSTRIVLIAFDLLCLNGQDLRKLPLLGRKAELRKIVDGTPVQFSESFEIDGREMYQHACKVGLEGAIALNRSMAHRTSCAIAQATSARIEGTSSHHRAQQPGAAELAIDHSRLNTPSRTNFPDRYRSVPTKR